MQLEAIHVQSRINTSTAVKKGNGTQRKAKVSPWCTHRSYCGWRKGTSRAEATSNGEKNEPVALAIVEVRRSEGISQSVSQKIPLDEKFLKFCSYLLKAFWVNLDLVLPNQYCHIVKWENWGWFWGIFCCRPRPHLCGPYYTVLLYCMIVSEVYKVYFFESTSVKA